MLLYHSIFLFIKGAKYFQNVFKKSWLCLILRTFAQILCLFFHECLMPWVYVELCTRYKVKKNLFWGESWLPLRNARTRVRLLHLLEATCYMLYSTNQSRPLEHMYPSWDNFNFFHNCRLQQIITIWYYFWLLETTWYYLRLLETTWDYLRLLKTT